MQKTLTIVVPTYNMEKYLDKCLTSLIVDKSYMDLFEVLIIIDGAKDRSSEIGHGYQDLYPNTFRVIDKENGNYGSCINRGLKEASGKYIKVLDADDYFDKSFVNYLLDIQKSDADLILNNFRTVDELGNEVERYSYNGLTNSGICSFSSVPVNIYMWMHAVAYKTENLRNISYKQTEGISYTDQEWIFLPMITVNTIQVTNYYLYDYLVGRSGQTMDPAVMKKNIWQEEKGLYTMLNYYKNLTNLSKDHQTYLRGRILSRLVYIYHTYLANKSIDDIAPLVKIDEELRINYPDIYALTNRVHTDFVFRQYYVSIWRKDNMRICNNYLYKIQNHLRYLIHKHTSKNKKGRMSHEIDCCSYLARLLS